MMSIGKRIVRIAVDSILHPLSTTFLEGTPPPKDAADPVDAATAIATRSIRKPASRTRAAPPITPPFKLIFLTVVVLTTASGLAQILLAQNWHDPSENQQQVFESLGFAWKAGIGAIIGLLGGKAT